MYNKVWNEICFLFRAADLNFLKIPQKLFENVRLTLSLYNTAYDWLDERNTEHGDNAVQSFQAQISQEP